MSVKIEINKLPIQGKEDEEEKFIWKNTSANENIPFNVTKCLQNKSIKSY
jgi:hypothetical protein